jgi:hypothetical protein
MGMESNKSEIQWPNGFISSFQRLANMDRVDTAMPQCIQRLKPLVAERCIMVSNRFPMPTHGNLIFSTWFAELD